MTKKCHLQAITWASMPIENSQPLFIQQLSLPPSDEWSPQCHGWIMVRVAEGSGYCIQKGNVCALNVGDGFMALGGTKVSVRASQLGDLHLQLVRIDPELINGLLTVAEWFNLEAGQGSTKGISFFKANEPTGQKFTRLAKQANTDRLPVRCALLQLWASLVTGWPAATTFSPVADTKLRHRFQQLVEQMPETELSRHSLSGLAQRLECSERHFSRLFRREFGVSFRSHQIDARLHHARQLLADPAKKISTVANESGYRHIGLFNSTFKKHFGMTPSEWRRQAGKLSAGEPTNHPKTTAERLPA